MQVILTPTAVADKFGPGLNGFKGSIPPIPPPTQLSAEWHDSVQMEIVNVIIGQGIALDGLVFDQLKQAIDDYSFVNPTIKSGGSLTILSGGTFTAAPGSTFEVDTLASFESPVNISTHVLSGAWDDTCLLSTRTFTSSGPVPGGLTYGFLFTSSNPADALRKFVLPQSCVVSFEITITVATGSAGADPVAGDINARVAKVTVIAIRNDGDYGNLVVGTITYLDTGFALNGTIDVSEAAGDLRLAYSWDVLAAGFPYRLGVAITAQPIAILDP